MDCNSESALAPTAAGSGGMTGLFAQSCSMGLSTSISES